MTVTNSDGIPTDDCLLKSEYTVQEQNKEKQRLLPEDKWEKENFIKFAYVMKELKYSDAQFYTYIEDRLKSKTLDTLREIANNITDMRDQDSLSELKEYQEKEQNLKYSYTLYILDKIDSPYIHLPVK